MSVSLELLPPLENGDRLSREEFERRYNVSPQLKKAELVEGIVYVASAVRANSHGKPHATIMGWLFLYQATTPGVYFADNATVRLDENNEVQPDAFLRLERGGTSKISHDDYIEGAPELVVEIAASSASYDLNDKLKAYRRNGVQEYLVWQSYEARFDWFQLKDKKYVALQPDDAGILRSHVFPGLWLSVPAFKEDKTAELIAILQQGLESVEHHEFVKKLQRKM